MPKVRQASHAGSWYTDDGKDLSASLSEWLSKVSSSQLPTPQSVCSTLPTTSTLALPVSGCRAIIAPHAGYSYSGPAAAYAYATIDTAGVERVFILGPSHHVYLDGCAVTNCDTYATPIGNLPVDKHVIEELKGTGKFTTMSQGEDEDEHSLEMHLPYVRKVFENQNGVKIVPIMVGAISTNKENVFGKLLAPYLKDAKNFFVISSDFCHWGTRFRYTYYKSQDSRVDGVHLTTRSPKSTYESYPIHQSIRELDQQGIQAITHPWTQDKEEAKTAEQARTAFVEYLKQTKNTVCGRHPIGVLLAALAELEKTQMIKSECRFTRYEQSSQVQSAGESSVSYASAYVRF
ncbi:related to protein tag-253 [Melanopsichium pennsylvanicum]|uniref:Related to protein tag-253 n=2 Tax=Melanopsichium pennsylvanicum TaxID=63383 RepID=A0AAJ4XS07_9BASI|nr:conserved hypothetical protein [Melanopsichium pennsylvanicum 4]SNX87322.1 related to protein tag-253 [Melanopsichium pennsylvanicum]